MKKLTLTLLTTILFLTPTMARSIDYYCCYSENSDYSDVMWLITEKDGDLNKVRLLNRESKAIISEDEIISTQVTRGIKKMRNHKGTMNLELDLDSRALTFELKSDFNSTIVDKTRLVCDEKATCDL